MKRSVLSTISIDAGPCGIRSVAFGRAGVQPESDLSASCLRQLREYLGGGRRTFSLPLDLSGTPFQRRVWAALQSVPWGATLTYGQLAKQIGSPRAVRAVASAVARNPVAVIIPCHRIVPASGDTGNYRWGAAMKKRLLQHESRVA